MTLVFSLIFNIEFEADEPKTGGSTTYLLLTWTTHTYSHLNNFFSFSFFCHIFRYLSLHFIVIILCLCLRWQKWRRRRQLQKTKHIKLFFTCKHWNKEKAKVEPLTSGILTNIRIVGNFWALLLARNTYTIYIYHPHLTHSNNASQNKKVHT